MKKMSREEANEIILDNCPKWFREELLEEVNERQHPDYWAEPEGWEEYYSPVDWLVDDFGFLREDPRSERIIKRIGIALGAYHKVQPGEYCQINNRVLRPGEYVHEYQYHELIDIDTKKI